MRNLLERRKGAFDGEFWQKLGRTEQWEAAQLIGHTLAGRPKITVVETFSFANDEFSPQIDTKIWAWMAQRWSALVNGCADSVEMARSLHRSCPSVKISLMDNIEFLREEAPLYRADLLFLGSKFTSVLEEELAYVAELPKKSLIAIRDCTGERKELAKQMLTEHQANFIFDGTVSIWEMN